MPKRYYTHVFYNLFDMPQYIFEELHAFFRTLREAVSFSYCSHLTCEFVHDVLPDAVSVVDQAEAGGDGVLGGAVILPLQVDCVQTKVTLLEMRIMSQFTAPGQISSSIEISDPR